MAYYHAVLIAVGSRLPTLSPALFLAKRAEVIGNISNELQQRAESGLRLPSDVFGMEEASEIIRGWARSIMPHDHGVMLI